MDVLIGLCDAELPPSRSFSHLSEIMKILPRKTLLDG
jgi:hypothetical protein